MNQDVSGKLETESCFGKSILRTCINELRSAGCSQINGCDIDGGGRIIILGGGPVGED